MLLKRGIVTTGTHSSPGNNGVQLLLLLSDSYPLFMMTTSCKCDLIAKCTVRTFCPHLLEVEAPRAMQHVLECSGCLTLRRRWHAWLLNLCYPVGSVSWSNSAWFCPQSNPASEDHKQPQRTTNMPQGMQSVHLLLPEPDRCWHTWAAINPHSLTDVSTITASSPHGMHRPSVHTPWYWR